VCENSLPANNYNNSSNIVKGCSGSLLSLSFSRGQVLSPSLRFPFLPLALPFPLPFPFPAGALGAKSHQRMAFELGLVVVVLVGFLLLARLVALWKWNGAECLCVGVSVGMGVRAIRCHSNSSRPGSRASRAALPEQNHPPVSPAVQPDPEFSRYR